MFIISDMDTRALLCVAIALALCINLSFSAPVLTSSPVTQQQILNSLSIQNRPYPSENLNAEGQWDMLMIMSFDIANHNFASMHADPDQYTMFNNFTVTDCVTPVQDWWYPPGTCLYIDVNLGPPVLGLTEDPREVVMTMVASSGVVTLSQPGYNNSQDLTGAVFNTEVDMDQTVFKVDNTLMYVDASHANITMDVTGYNLNPNIIQYLDVEMSGAMRNISTTTTYPFVLYYTGTSGQDPCLVPTLFEMTQFRSEVDGSDLAAFFIMTEGRSPPSQKYVDESMAYLPDGSNVFFLISNRLLVSRMIPQGMSKEYSQTIVKMTTSMNHQYYNLKGTFNPNQNFTAYQSYSQKEENGGSAGPVEVCSLKGKESYEIILGDYTMSLSNIPSDSLNITNLDQKIKLPYCYTGDGGSFGAYETVTTSYVKTATLFVDGGNLNSTSSTSGGTEYPSNSHWDDAFTNQQSEQKQAESALKAVGPAISASLDTSTIFVSFNIFKDEQVFFGDIQGFALTGSSVLYDLVLFGNVQL